MLRAATSLFLLLGALDMARRKKKNWEEEQSTIILALRSAVRDLLLFTIYFALEQTLSIYKMKKGEFFT